VEARCALEAGVGSMAVERWECDWWCFGLLLPMDCAIDVTLAEFVDVGPCSSISFALNPRYTSLLVA